MKTELKSDFSELIDKTKTTPLRENAIWARILDCQYGCEVQRTEPYKGILIIEDLVNQKLIHKEEVHISYDARFGPDMYDAQVWSVKACNVVDSLPK